MFYRKVIIPAVEGLHYYTQKKTLKTIMMYTIAQPVNIHILAVHYHMNQVLTLEQWYHITTFVTQSVPRWKE